MTPNELRKFEIELRQRRNRVFDVYEQEEHDLLAIAEGREPELEERAQSAVASEILATLDDRSRKEIERIDAALDRIALGTYGLCTTCEEDIAPARLEALPETTFCVECARELEKAHEARGSEIASPKSGNILSDLGA